MRYTKSYRRYRSTNRKAIRSGGIRRHYSGTKYMPRPMTSGKVRRIIDAELKVSDLNIGLLAMPDTVGARFHLSNISLGDANTERTGNWIKPVSLMGTLIVQAQLGTSVTTPRFKVFVVQWREDAVLNTPDLVKIVQDVVEPHQQFNVESKGQFKILWSWTGTVVPNADNPQFVKTKRFYLKPPRKILYDDDVLKKEQLYLFGFSDVDGLDNPPFISGNIRLRYTDS